MMICIGCGITIAIATAIMGQTGHVSGHLVAVLANPAAAAKLENATCLTVKCASRHFYCAYYVSNTIGLMV
jgi:hypothetical protein